MLRAIAAPSAHCVYRATSRPLATKARRPKRSKTEFITRRHTYRQQVHELRKQFADEFQAEKTETVQDELEDRQQRMEAKIERRERRNAVSAGKQEAHLKQLADIKAIKEERTAFNFELWTKKQAELAAKKQESFDSVVEASKSWVTDDNLDRHIERAVDSFFIAGDASQRGQVI